MSFAHAHPLVPVGESLRAQKIEFRLPNLKLQKMSNLRKMMSFLSDTT